MCIVLRMCFLPTKELRQSFFFFFFLAGNVGPNIRAYEQARWFAGGCGTVKVLSQFDIGRTSCQLRKSFCYIAVLLR